MKLFIVILFLMLISISVIFPFFHKGYFTTHDGEWAVIRLTDMYRELKDLQIPPRISSNLNFGYGYPLFNFVYPFPYYLGFIIHLLKIGFVDSIKTMFALSVPFSILFMYFASSNLWRSRLAGIVSAVLYGFFPYRFVDLYVRGSLGESLAFVFFPLLFFFILKILSQGRIIYIISAGLIYGVLILTHNIMAVYFSIFIVLFLLGRFFMISKKNIFFSFYSLIIGIGLSSFFWVPALLEKKYILLSKIPIADRTLYFVSLKQLVLPSWGYGTPLDSNAFSYQLGLPYIFIFLLSIFYLIIFVFNKKNEDMPSHIKTFILVGIICFFVFLLFKESKIFWNLPLLKEINYPWTLLGILGFLTSLLAGFSAIKKNIKYISLILSFIAIFLYLPFAKPLYYINREDDFYLTNDATTTSSSELMPLWVKEKPKKRFLSKVEIIRGKGEIRNVFYNSKTVNFNADIEKDSKLRINTIYYPGWVVNKGNLNIDYSNNLGVIEFNLVKGSYKINAELKETGMRSIANLISLVFIGTTFIVYFFRNKIISQKLIPLK